MKHLQLTSAGFIQLILEFTHWFEQLGYSKAEATNNSSRLQEFLHFLEINGVQNIEKINLDIAKKYLGYISIRPKQTAGGALSLNYQNKHINTLHHLGKYLRLMKKVETGLHFSYYDYEQAKRLSLSTDEIGLLYKAAKLSTYEPRDKAILAIYYGCGLRRSEGVNLRLKDLLFEKDLVHVRKTKNSRERYVPMGRKVRGDLRVYIRTHRHYCLINSTANRDELFISNFGKPLTGSGLFRNFKRLVGQTKNQSLIDKKPGLHTLRHSIATHLLDSGMDLEYVGRFLGHACIGSTQVYTHLKHEKLKGLQTG